MRAVNFQANTGDFQSWSEESFREIERASRDFDPHALDFLGAAAQGNIIYYNGTAWVLVAGREKLTADRTYYVRADGSDANTGLANTAAGAFLTLQGAYNYIAAAIDFGGKTVTIQLADGTYAALTINTAWVGGGNLTIQGNPVTRANVVIAGGALSAIRWNVPLPGKLTVKDFKPTGSQPTAASLHGFAAGSCEFTNLDFGTGGAAHILAQAPAASIIATGDYGISGSASAHMYSVRFSQIDTSRRVITITGTPAFPDSYARSEAGGLLVAFGQTFSGAATGPRYFVDGTSAIITAGGGPNALPGDAAGFEGAPGHYT